MTRPLSSRQSKKTKKSTKYPKAVCANCAGCCIFTDETRYPFAVRSEATNGEGTNGEGIPRRNFPADYAAYASWYSIGVIQFSLS